MSKRKDMRDELRRKRKQREARRTPLRGRDEIGAGLLDMSARNAATFAEYRAYRDLVGPPPGMRRLQPGR